MATITAVAWAKVAAAMGAIGVAAPALLWKALPTGEDFKAKYPEDYQPEVVRERQKNVQAMEEYLTKLKEYSKDSRNIWIVMKEEEEKARRQYARADAQRQKVAAEELAARRAEIRREIASGNETR